MFFRYFFMLQNSFSFSFFDDVWYFQIILGLEQMFSNRFMNITVLSLLTHYLFYLMRHIFSSLYPLVFFL